jgi:hypothetical protein
MDRRVGEGMIAGPWSPFEEGTRDGKPGGKRIGRAGCNDIRRVTRRLFLAEGKTPIALEGLRGDERHPDEAGIAVIAVTDQRFEVSNTPNYLG